MAMILLKLPVRLQPRAALLKTTETGWDAALFVTPAKAGA